jgi:Fe-S oxidoreductase
MLHLPLLVPHQDALEKCVYCPKLSRAACPVSNVEASETVTPWGKMSMAYFAARKDVPIDQVHADPAWACLACYACRECCDHRNDVAETLLDARAEFFARSAAPEAAVRAAERFPERAEQASRAMTAIAADVQSDDPSATTVLVGCAYARNFPAVARDALLATQALVGGPVRAARACCGLPLLHAGDRPGFIAAARAFAEDVARSPRLVVVDPGCARALFVDYPRLGVAIEAPELFIDLAAGALDRLAVLPGLDDVRWHDPCQLGRGLDRYDAPRAVLERIAGRPPSEFQRCREQAECSGAGGLLPATRPETSRAIAEARIGEHQRLGGGTLVTACAQSLRRFRTSGELAVDLTQLVARALGIPEQPVDCP